MNELDKKLIEYTLINITEDYSKSRSTNQTYRGFNKAVEFWSYHQDECTIEQLAHRLSNFGNTIHISV